MCRRKSPREGEDAAGRREDERGAGLHDRACASENRRVALSNAIVGQAARVQAIASATFSVCPDSVKELEHMLQSARVEILPSASVTV